MNFRLNALLLVIAAVLLGWYWSLQPNDEAALSGLIKKEGAAEYVGERMNTNVYDLKGQLQYAAEASEVKRYETTERTEFFKPFLKLFDQVDKLNQWKVSADYAEISKEKMLRLSGNVKIEALEAASRLQKIETDELNVDLNTQDVFTDSQVKTLGMGFTTMGTGLRGNLKQQTATLTKDVKTYIEPTVIREAEEKQKSNKEKQ
jgi:lipopolysaccharide export system protein LptC